MATGDRPGPGTGRPPATDSSTSAPSGATPAANTPPGDETGDLETRAALLPDCAPPPVAGPDDRDWLERNRVTLVVLTMVATIVLAVLFGIGLLEPIVPAL